MTSSIADRAAAGLAALACAGAVLAAGCVSSSLYRQEPVAQAAVDAYLADKPQPLHASYERVIREGRRNLVRNQLEAGLGAMEQGHLELAERSFDEALGGIETVYANNERAARARSLWVEEGMKDWRGEPYERAMAYHYRGLLYLRRGDYDNARACFKSGVLQDAFAEEEQHRCDFALLIFLEGWASHCAGDRALAAEAFDEVLTLRPDWTPPAPEDNVLVLVDTGTAPRKVAVGAGEAALAFERGADNAEQRVRLQIGEREATAYPMEDVFWQASTRGGRPIERILQRQVVFKETQQTMGSVLTAASISALAVSHEFGDDKDEVRIAAAAVGLLGLTQQLIASQVKTRADTRSWRNLPNAVHACTLHLAPGRQHVRAAFFDASGAELSRLASETEIGFPDGRHGIAWLRSRPAVGVHAAS